MIDDTGNFMSELSVPVPFGECHEMIKYRYPHTVFLCMAILVPVPVLASRDFEEGCLTTIFSIFTSTIMVPRIRRYNVTLLEID